MWLAIDIKMNNETVWKALDEYFDKDFHQFTFSELCLFNYAASQIKPSHISK